MPTSEVGFPAQLEAGISHATDLQGTGHPESRLGGHHAQRRCCLGGGHILSGKNWGVVPAEMVS